jgi:hypothetical protein
VGPLCPPATITVLIADAPALVPATVIPFRCCFSSARATCVTIFEVSPGANEIVPVAPPKHQARFGSCKGMLSIVLDDDEHLEDFAEYMR